MKKNIYDQHGKAGLKDRGHTSSNQNPQDVFSDLFGGAFSDFFSGQSRLKTGRPAT